MTASPVEASSASQSIMDMEREFLLQNYARYPLVLHRGKGAYVYDMDGKRYLDLIAGIGVNALGHAHPRIVKVIRQQAGLLIHCSNLYYHQYQGALAKALAAEPRILILLEPTRGIDIGAKVEIYETLGRLAAQKRAILMISSDLDELRHVADRLLIFYRGRIQGELSRAEATAEAVTLLATGQPLEAAG